jgi:hypothetical protein
MHQNDAKSPSMDGAIAVYGFADSLLRNHRCRKGEGLRLAPFFMRLKEKRRR